MKIAIIHAIACIVTAFCLTCIDVHVEWSETSYSSEGAAYSRESNGIRSGAFFFTVVDQGGVAPSSGGFSLHTPEFADACGCGGWMGAIGCSVSVFIAVPILYGLTLLAVYTAKACWLIFWYRLSRVRIYKGGMQLTGKP